MRLDAQKPNEHSPEGEAAQHGGAQTAEELHKIAAALRQRIDSLEAELSGRQQIETSDQRLAAIVESSDDAIVSKTLQGIITSWNKGAERIFGYTAAEAIGRPITMLIPENHLDEEPRIIERIRAGERIDHYETIRRRKDGSKVEISLTVSPIKDSGGCIIGASKIARDISETKRSAERLAESLEREKAAREQAEAATRAKDDFLAALSHELRTPLNPVLLLASDGAGNKTLPPEVRADFDMIRKNAESEARLIDDLLDLTRINHGKLRLNLQMVDAHALVREAALTARPQADAKKIHLIFRLHAEQHMLSGDPLRLQQTFWNILKNSVKFTPEGGKVLVESFSEGGRWVLKISDNGLGMTSKELQTIFTAFAQGDHARDHSNRFGGLGLGLAISKRLAEIHCGKIRAESPGRHQGSTFTIELPLARINGSAGSPAPNGNGSCVETSDTRNERILLVEDHEATRNVLASLLGRRRYWIVKASSVAEARSLAAKERFDLIISDIGLPDGSGYDLMAELHDRFGLRGIALTGFGREQAENRPRPKGFITHLTKPVRIQDLESALALAALAEG
jgi:PAS domain S-box-containing protein